ncbi:MAG: hypothetical protein G01um10143_525 [Parcubacteria group bacterium Gr01-1014_3]|nr:MAG: hypothetical protein G01um10143_525 [Parcubacteria group bacterium Gr01-1014_3]
MGNHDQDRYLRPNEQKVMFFLIGALYLTDPKIKSHFCQYLDDHSVDWAIYKLIKQKNLPEWFANEMRWFDPLYSLLHELRPKISLAVTYGLVRIDGDRYRYHLDEVSEPLLRRLLMDEKLDYAEVKKFADDLSQEILNPTK